MPSDRSISLRLAPTTATKNPSPTGLLAKLEAIRGELLTLDSAAVVSTLGVGQHDRILKSTISLCPLCLAHVPAVVYTLAGRVLIHKQCPAHGPSQAVLENDESFYHLSNKDRWGRRYADDKVVDFPAYDGGCCDGGTCDPAPGGPLAGGAEATDAVNAAGFADQMSNKSCTVLVEVTNACNLACPVCYSDAKGDRKLPLEAFQRYMLRLIEAKGGLDSVQLTGGEAALHPEFWEMVAFLHAQPGVKKIYLPTNGILFAKPEVAARLTPFRDRVMVLLQFDGREPATNQALRAANPASTRDRVIANLARLGIQTQLTMTMSRGVNDDEVGWVVETGLRHNHVKVIAIQPATYSGRYDLAPDPLHRLKLSDVVKAVVAQVNRRMKAEDFVPIPCSHPNCGWITLFVRRFGLAVNVVRHVDVAQVMGRVANRTVMGTNELREVIGSKSRGPLASLAASAGRRLVRSQDVLGIAIKPFMDRFSYDQDRVSACCHHLLDTHGRPVSFCEYNARLRTADSWERLPKLRESDGA